MIYNHLKYPWKIWVLLLFILFCNNGFSQTNPTSSFSSKEKTLTDSLLNTFTIEELAKFKAFYENEIRLLEKEKRLLQKKGIDDGEKLFAISPSGQFMDKVLFRLAEYYYQKEQDDLFKRLDKYEKEYAKFEAGKRDNPPEEPRPEYGKVIEKYKLIIKAFPDSPLMDDVLYHLAYTYDKNFQPDTALRYYKQVAERFPESRNAPEALIRIGEYYFNPVRRELDKAIQYYTRVLDYRNTPRYDEALYKLGWCHYLKEEFDRAIENFTLLVNDIRKNRSLDPLGEYTNPSLKEEALEYIGICFHDAGGLSRALAFIDSLNRPKYGIDVLTKIGGIYQDNEEKYGKAIHTYLALLERYPYYSKAPAIQGKIVDCARELEDNHEIYLAQEKLFNTYHPGSEWSQKISEKIDDPQQLQKILDTAYKKAETALRDNINLSIRLGEENEDASYYNLAVKDAQKYLKAFPYDTNAYTIHWNKAVIQDTKLNQKEAAFEEYLNLCNNYVQDKFRKPAAQNAIVLAREMNQTSISSDSSAIISDSLQMVSRIDSIGSSNKEPKELTQSQKQLIQAYDNFIKHFPHEDETASVLGNVGNMYYNKEQFNYALRYFKTLLHRFPDSPTSKRAQFTAMESYFGKRDYANTEIMAKQIQKREDLPAELKQKARKRLAESIFLHAESLAGEKKHLESANEFKRMVKEVPDALFADKALFQAGVQFDRASKYDQAIEMYSQLMNRFPKSDHYLDAINNLALDYAELEKYQLAAGTYEKLANHHPDTSKVQDALFNASHFYVKAKDWHNAIRINRTYVENYPHAEGSEDMFYNMATYYLNLDDYEHANEIYGEFAQKYPNSPRTVETYYRRGDYFIGKGRTKEAFQEFDLAVEKNEELKSNGLPANDYYAAEALFAKSEEQFKDYTSIRFKQYNLESAKKRKSKLLGQLKDQYKKVAAYGTIRIYEAMFKLGRLYEIFAESWANQEMPQLSESEKIVFSKKVNKTASQLYDRAFGSYKASYKTFNKLAEKYQKTETDSSDGADEKSEIKRVVEEDSTLQVASRWLDKTGSKISEMLYRIADLNAGSVEQLLQSSIPQDLDRLSRLEYRNQVLKKAVFPIVHEITKAHIRNLNEADSLSLDNVWVERSQKKLMDVMGVLPTRYKKLCLDAFDTYQTKYDEYVKIMTKGTQTEKENALDLAGDLVNIIDMSKNYASLMIANYKASIQQLNRLESGQIVAQSLFTDCVYTTAELANEFHQAAEASCKMKDHFTILNQETPKMVYEDAIFTFADGETYLTDNALAICEETYDLKKEYDFKSLKFANIASLMVELDPEMYAHEFDMEARETEMVADSSWVMATNVRDSTWTLPEHSGENWSPAMVRIDTSSEETPVILSYRTMDDSVLNDSTAAIFQDSAAIAKSVNEKIFLRKELLLDDIPISALLSINADDNVWVYLNGVEVFNETGEDLGWGNRFEVDLIPFLRSGKNTLAILAEDSDKSGHGVQPKLSFKMIQRNELSKQEKVLVQKELDNYGVQDITDLIFNRYIVPE